MTRQTLSKYARKANQMNRGNALEDRVSPKDIEQILATWGEECFYCGIEIEFFSQDPSGTFDHLIPRARGGKTSIRNLIPACLACNNRKDEKRAKWDSKTQRIIFTWEGVKPHWGNNSYLSYIRRPR